MSSTGSARDETLADMVAFIRAKFAEDATVAASRVAAQHGDITASE